MSSVKRKFIVALLACIAVPAALMQQAVGQSAQFRKDLAELTKSPHRLAGYEDGSLAAGRYVEKRLREMGIEKIFMQEFPVIQPVCTECRIEVNGEKYDILPMRPNILQASVTPAEGLVGETLYVGKGEMSDYGRQLPKGKIVVIDFDCGKNWLNAFAFGASAVIFVGGDETDAKPYHHVNVPANLPRFFVPKELAEKLELKTRPQQIKLFAACRWRELVGRNVIAVLPGTSPKISSDTLPQDILLAAPLDSLSEVPQLSPGARDAANCAALLKMAEYFKKNPPKRNVIICFFDGQCSNHLGARAFYGALGREKCTTEYKRIEDRLDNFGKERKFIEQVLKIMESRDLFSGSVRSMKYHNEAIRLLAQEARNRSGDALEELRPLRNRLRDIHTEKRHLIQKLEELEKNGDAVRGEQVRQQIAEMDRQLEDLAAAEKKLNAADTAWNRLEGALRGGNISESNREHYEMLVEDTRRLLANRVTELDRLTKFAEQARMLRDAIGDEKQSIVMHISINLSDARRRWSFIHGDDTEPIGNDRAGIYSSTFKTIRSIYESSPGSFRLFDENPALAPSSEIRLYAPGLYVDSGAAARLFAIPNLSAMTVLDPLGKQGLPCDTTANLDAGVIEAQADDIQKFIRVFADSDAFNPGSYQNTARFDEMQWQADKSRGPAVTRAGAGMAMADRPVPDAIVAIVLKSAIKPWDLGKIEKTPPGFVFPVIVKTNTYGIFEAGPLHAANYAMPLLFAAKFDEPADGTPSRGIIQYVSAEDSAITTKTMNLSAVNLFKTRFKTLVGYGFDQTSAKTIAMRAASTSEFRKDNHLLCEMDNIMTLYAPYNARGMKLFNRAGIVALNNKPDKEEYQGVGLSLENPFEQLVSVEITARDQRILNEYRLNTLRENHINQDSLEVLNSKSKELYEDAELIHRLMVEGASAAETAEGSATTQPAEATVVSLDKYAGDLSASAAYAKRPYTPLVGVLNDLVTAVVLLLLMAMPFAYALERLLIGTPHIYRQIGWFTVFFLATFAILYMINPAFRIASTPIIIFLAFTIILLSSLVIFIMMRKLQTEVKKMQGLATTVHSADVSRLSTMMAAVNMGISTMRRRPLRTLLTAVTVVLLTFTVLTFASFGSSWGLWKTYEMPLGSMPQRIMVHHQLWNPIPDGTVDMVRGHLQGKADVVPRYWVSATSSDAYTALTLESSTDMVLCTEDIQKPITVAAAIGMDSRDTARQSELADMLHGQISLLDTDGIFLTDIVGKHLGLTDADIGRTKILLDGRKLTYAGRISGKFTTFTSLEGSSLLPVDYKVIGLDSLYQLNKTLTADSSADMPDMQSAQFVTYNADRVVIISPRAAKDMGGMVRAITVYPNDPDATEELADRVANITALPTYAGYRGGVYRMLFTSIARASGWKDLLIPVLLGGLIIFATMLSSVSDREKEIYTFSSLGLAPPHIASLFFAEASIYAVVGGMGGYLLGQAVARVLGWMSQMGYVTVPPMNYSSTNAIVTILIVMGTVLISTIYPAVKASRSANPGIQRSWKIPKPKDNTYDMVFPFTVSAYDITGVVSFLHEHFENYSDTSMGIFAASNYHIIRQSGNDMLGFRADVALAPFDLGVSQKFIMLSQPSEIEGIDEVRVVIRRISGASSDWQRANRVFINDLRKQLLIWRSLPHEVMEKYRQQTMKQWDALPVETVSFGREDDRHDAEYGDVS